MDSAGSPMNNHSFSLQLEDDTLFIRGALVMGGVDDFVRFADRLLGDYAMDELTINLEQVSEMDSSGIASVQVVQQKLKKRKITILVVGGPQDMLYRNMAESDDPFSGEVTESKPGFFEKIGSRFQLVFSEYIRTYIALAADISFWSIAGLFSGRAHRKGEVINQAVIMGVNAAFIVGIMAFIIGLVLALQSAAQLRSFGANIYIVDLTVIAMMSEMGPLITAIIVAGRSGSSIAAEISAMKVTSETDALKTMGLNPVRFIVVPKMHGGIITMPFLTILADVMGILGGLVIAMTYLDISPVVFMNRMKESLFLKDIIFGVIKSLVFIYLIVFTGSYFGFRAEQGASGVGRVTTKAVVVSISLVIIADSIMGLIFY